MKILEKCAKRLVREERGLTVDILNNPVRAVRRDKINADKLYIRQSAVVVTSQDKIFVQQRALDKDSFPGFWEISMGGLIQHGETDELAAKRELQEELGVSGVPLSYICTMSVANEGWFYWAVFYHARWEGQVKIDKTETEQVQLFSLTDIRHMIIHGIQFTPLSLRFLEHKAKLLEDILTEHHN